MEKVKNKPGKRKSRRDTEYEDGDSSQNRDDQQSESDRRSSRVKVNILLRDSSPVPNAPPISLQKPKLVFDPSDQLAPYKKLNFDELTKSPKKFSEPPVERKPAQYKGIINFEDRTCKICTKMLEGMPSVICIVCDDGYHCYCHEPRVGKTTRKSTWKCINCRPESAPTSTAQTTPQQTPSAETSRRSSINKSEQQSEEEFGGFESDNKKATNGKSNGIEEELEADDDDEGHIIDGNMKIDLAKAKALLNISHNTMPNMDTVPDCAAWECNEVYDYFYKFFPTEAHIFKEQEIDGTSLMLMTRSDMLKFNLKLGPALNIYRHIVMLQSRSYDPRKTWK